MHATSAQGTLEPQSGAHHYNHSPNPTHLGVEQLHRLGGRLKHLLHVALEDHFLQMHAGMHDHTAHEVVPEVARQRVGQHPAAPVTSAGLVLVSEIDNVHERCYATTKVNGVVQ